MVWIGHSGVWRGGVTRYDGVTWKTFTVEDGLASNDVRVIAVDHENNVWVGTSERLCRYKGETWETFPLDGFFDHAQINSIEVAPDGRVMIGAWGGKVLVSLYMNTVAGLQ